MYAYVGGYSSPDRNGQADGINVYRIEDPEAPWVHIQHVPSFDNPSFLRIGPDGSTLYAAHGGRAHVSAYTLNRETGHATPLCLVDIGGRNPVDFGFDRTGTRMVVACYSSGSIVVLPVQPGGALGEPTQTIVLPPRPHPTAAQPGSLPHGVTPDPSGEYLLIPDKGLDQIFVCRFQNGALTQVSSAVSTPGAGPRHAAFHPVLPILYVVNELDSSVETFRWQDGALSRLQHVRGIPDGDTAASFASEIAVSPDGVCVYSSNRGHDSIARFLVDQATGLLACADCTPVLGVEPRFFTLDPGGKHLHVANQNTHAIVSFRRATDGALSNGRVTIQVGSPTALCFVSS